MHFIKRAAARAIAAPASTIIRAAPRSSSTPFAIRNQTTILSAFRRYNSTEAPVQEPVAADASEQQSVRSAVSSANQYKSSYPEQRQEFGSRRPPPEITPNKSIYIGNLIFEATPENLQREFESFGEITSIKIAQDARGLSKGFGYIEFKDVESATAAIKERHQSEFEGRRLIVNYMAKSRNDAAPKNPPSKTLFIGNLAFEMTDADLNRLFRDIANVIDVRVAIDRRTGQPRGFAHADFIDVESAVKASEVLNGKEVYNRPLRIDYSTSVSRSAHGGRFGGRDGGRDGGRERSERSEQSSF